MGAIDALTEPLQVNRPAIIDETIDHEVVIVDMEHGSYYSVRGAGVEIWHALTEPATSQTVVARVAAQFGQDEADIAPTVHAFVAELAEHGLLKPSPEAANTSAMLPDGEPLTFEPPSLEKFTDMEDLLLLDPVHDVDGRGWPHPAPSD